MMTSLWSLCLLSILLWLELHDYIIFFQLQRSSMGKLECGSQMQKFHEQASRELDFMLSEVHTSVLKTMLPMFPPGS
jgi:hypothetical protein